MPPSLFFGIITVLGYLTVTGCYSEGHESIFAVYNRQLQSCNGSCTEIEDNATRFLATAPCPKSSSLQLVCQHGFRLSCEEVATILSHCISRNDVSCSLVLSALEACVCQFNMTCLATDKANFSRCGWNEKGSLCGTSSSVSTNGVTSNIETITEERTTVRIGESTSIENVTCGLVCIFIAFLGALLGCIISAITVFLCCKRSSLRRRKTGPMPGTTIMYMDTEYKDSKDNSSGTISQFGNDYTCQPFPDQKASCMKVGRPCSGFDTKMFDRTEQANHRRDVPFRSSVSVGSDVPLDTNVPLDSDAPLDAGVPLDSDVPLGSGVPLGSEVLTLSSLHHSWCLHKWSGSHLLQIPRPMLKTFVLEAPQHNNDGIDEIGQCNYEEPMYFYTKL